MQTHTHSHKHTPKYLPSLTSCYLSHLCPYFSRPGLLRMIGRLEAMCCRPLMNSHYRRWNAESGDCSLTSSDHTGEIIGGECVSQRRKFIDPQDNTPSIQAVQFKKPRLTLENLLDLWCPLPPAACYCMLPLFTESNRTKISAEWQQTFRSVENKTNIFNHWFIQFKNLKYDLIIFILRTSCQIFLTLRENI